MNIGRKEGCNIGIRISHGDVGTFAKFGIEAGKGEQKVRQEAEAHTTARAREAQNAQLAAQSMRISADINQTILDAQARKEAMAFQSFLQGESAKRTMAWEVEKTELSRQHDFEKQIQRKDLEIDLMMQQEAMQQSRLDAKITAINDAAEQGLITPEQAADEITRIKLGAPSGRYGTVTAEDRVVQEYIDERRRKDATDVTAAAAPFVPQKPKDLIAPKQANSTKLLSIANSKSTDAKVAADMKAILKEGDANKIKVALDVAQAGIAAREQSAMARSYDFDMRQSMGSFR